MILTAASTAQELPVERVVEPPAVEEAMAPVAVQFVDVNDAMPSRFFDASQTVADAVDPNKLIIAFHSDSDPATWKANDFRASTAAFSHLSAIDTISFRVVAPTGRHIARIIYTQRGTGSSVRLGRTAGGTHWVVGDFAAQLGLFGTNPSVNGIADFTDQQVSSVPVSITTGLFAFAAPMAGSASIAVTSAEVQVELVPETE
jgi:hypothetical protein